MHLILFDINQHLTRAWTEQFSTPNYYLDRVTSVNNRLEDIIGPPQARKGWPIDALVSPANSFGIMDGGIDLKIRDTFPGLQERVTAHLATRFDGFQPVGTSTIIETGDETTRWLIHTPTMRWPGRLQDPLVVYDATRSILKAVKDHNSDASESNQIKMVACPGLGTLTGGLNEVVAAKLMRIAFEHSERENTSVENWREAQKLIRDMLGPIS